MMLRVQAERMHGAFFPSAREYAVRYGLSERRAPCCPSTRPCLHPGPMVRGMEIAPAVADAPSSAVLAQVQNGVHVRMAVLYHLLGGGGGATERGVSAGCCAAPRPYGEGEPPRRPGPPTGGRRRSVGRGCPGRQAHETLDADGLVAAARVRRPAHAPAGARRGGLRDPRDRLGRPPRSAGTPRCSRCPTPTRWPTPPSSSSTCTGSGAEVGLVDVHPVGAVTVGSRGERMAELGTMAASGPGCGCSPTTARCVSDPVADAPGAGVRLRAGRPSIAQHAEDHRLTAGAQAHEGAVAARLGLAGWPATAEEAIVARDCALAREAGARLHVCHVSTARTRSRCCGAAKARGGPGQRRGHPAPPAAHRRGARRLRPRAQGQPAAAHRRRPGGACATALAEGVIDVVATDHAPHAAQYKDTSGPRPRPGMLGLQTALSVVVRGPGGAGAARLARRRPRVMSQRPAEIGRPGRPGQAVAVGEPGDVRPRRSRRPVDEVDAGAALRSRGANTPYEGDAAAGDGGRDGVARPGSRRERGRSSG